MWGFRDKKPAGRPGYEAKHIIPANMHTHTHTVAGSLAAVNPLVVPSGRSNSPQGTPPLENEGPRHRGGQYTPLLSSGQYSREFTGMLKKHTIL